MNTFEVAEKGVDFYYLKDVLHGTVSICKYTSSINRHLKECYVYTPAGYEEKVKSGVKYPVYICFMELEKMKQTGYGRAR